MAVAKIYNSQTGQWEAVIVGTTGDTGVVQSATEPSNTDQLWLDTDDTAEPLAIPAGGTAGQILQKSTDGDYDTAWSNVPSHNYIINGAFDIWQRGDSFDDSSEGYTADRWAYNHPGGSTGTLTKKTFTPSELPVASFGESPFYLELDVTDQGTAYSQIEQKVEDARTLAGQTVTLSFWAKADSNKSVSTIMQQTYDSGSGTSSASVINHSLTSTWQRFTHTLTLWDLSGVTLGANSHVRVIFRSTEVATLSFWGVQLEAGSVATPFKRHAPSLQGELAACQRYYERLLGAQITNAHYYSSTLAIGVIPYTTKRTSPAVSASSETDFRVYSSGSFRASSAITFISPGFESVQIQATTSSATAGNGAWIQVQNDEYIELDSEL